MLISVFRIIYELILHAVPKEFFSSTTAWLLSPVTNPSDIVHQTVVMCDFSKLSLGPTGTRYNGI